MAFATCVRDILLLLLHQAKHSRGQTEKAQIIEGRGTNQGDKDFKGVVICAHKHIHTLNKRVKRGGSKEASAFKSLM